jgi:hypothetical protein
MVLKMEIKNYSKWRKNSRWLPIPIDKSDSASFAVGFTSQTPLIHLYGAYRAL